MSRKTVTITDVTRMQSGNVCVAGYLPDHTCIRPVLAHGGLAETWLYVASEVVIRPFATIELEVQRLAGGRPPHTEDQVIDPIYRRRHALLADEARVRLLNEILDPDVTTIFGAPIHHESGWYIQAGEGQRSLGTIRPTQVESVSYRWVEEGRWEYRLTFQDAAGVAYRLSVADLAFRYCLDYLRQRKGMAAEEAAACLTHALRHRDVYLRIGLARMWQKHPDRCYLQVTGIHTFPDYLQGRCFADLAPAEHKPAAPAQPREPLPF